jgi:hypothetical protein
MILESLLASTAFPLVLDLVKQVTNKYVGLSVDDQIKMDNAQVEKMKALAQLDNPYGTPSQWVVDLRASFRYLGSILVIGIGVFIISSMPTQLEAGLSLVTMPFGFIFGERLILSFKGPGNK